jgi:NADH dehydrogenase
MASPALHVVTGAFGYSGKYIAARLLQAGHRVRTLTNSPNRTNPFDGTVEAVPYHFDDPAALEASLRGVAVLYNTYWVRFNAADFTHEQAVRNTLTLFAAAVRAGVGRIVHVSITNPSEDSPLEYFRGKARLEKALIATGLSHAILRPAVLFGGEDILINNIAWALRHLPVFGVFGKGDYGMQPIYVDDLAALAVEQGGRAENVIIDAIGPETYTYRELVRTLGHIICCPRPIISVPPWLGYLAVTLVGKLVNDVMMTREEMAGLMQGLLCTDSPPAGTTALSAWAQEHRDTLGRHYASEMARRQNRTRAYDRR